MASEKGLDDFEVEAVIAAFLADATRSALEMPKLTTGQRKEARRIAEQHLGLRCDSFGLAADRRLHLFKLEDEAAPKQQQQPYKPQPACSPEGSEAGDSVSSTTTVDIEAVVGEFLADFSRTVLELPRLTTGQRKQAKRLAEQHELSCESCGLACDRRLRFFKQGAGLEDPLTFPLKLPKAATDKTAAAEEQRLGECSSSASTCTSAGRGSGIGQPSSLPRALSTSLSILSPVSSLAGGETPSLPRGLQVRNTFICGLDGEVRDARITQSMPHGMFRLLLLDDLDDIKRNLSGEALGSEEEAMPSVVLGSPPEAPPAVAAAEAQETKQEQRRPAFEPGVEVIVEGLTKCPAFNGKQGTVQSLDEETGRYDILLCASSGASGQQWAKVRAENLRLFSLPEPPRFAPTLADSTAATSLELAASAASAAAGCAAPVMEQQPVHCALVALDASQLGIAQGVTMEGGYLEVMQDWSAWEAYGEQSFVDHSWGYYPAQMAAYA